MVARFGSEARARARGAASTGPGIVLAGLLGLALALALASCGVTTVSTTGGTSSTSATATARASGSAIATATSTGRPGTLGVRPCTGPLGSAAQAGTPAVVLTPTNARQPATVHVGDLVQVRLPTSLRWSLSGVPAQLSPVGQGSVQDGTLNACVWTFRAVSPGTAALHYTGSAICEGAKPCAQFALALDFTVNVS